MLLFFFFPLFFLLYKLAAVCCFTFVVIIVVCFAVSLNTPSSLPQGFGKIPLQEATLIEDPNEQFQFTVDDGGRRINIISLKFYFLNGR